MARLTYKDNDNSYKLLRGRECQWKKAIKEEYSTIDNSIQKLGQLEDLMEKYKIEDIEMLEKIIVRHDKYCGIEISIGCPLDFVATPYRFSGLRKIWYHKQWCEVVRIVVYEEMTRPYMEVICKGYKYLKMIFLDDYKIIWWLREDKSE